MGLTGSLIILLANLITALRYSGRNGEPYSMLNHFISELGEVGISPAARIFNTGLIFGGLLVAPFMFGLGQALHSLWGWLGTLFGLIAALGATFVGLYPMNNIKPHTRAAMTFFRAGLGMEICFGLAVFFQPSGQVVIPFAANFFSLFAILAFGAFLLLSDFIKNDKTGQILDPQQTPQRPRFWLLPAIEWTVYLATLAWILGWVLVTW